MDTWAVVCLLALAVVAVLMFAAVADAYISMLKAQARRAKAEASEIERELVRLRSPKPFPANRMEQVL